MMSSFIAQSMVVSIKGAHVGRNIERFHFDKANAAIMAESFPRVTQAAVPTTSAAAAPAVTRAASQRKRFAKYSPEASSNSFRFTGCLAAKLIAACTSSGMVDAESTV